MMWLSVCLSYLRGSTLISLYINFIIVACGSWCFISLPGIKTVPLFVTLCFACISASSVMWYWHYINWQLAAIPVTSTYLVCFASKEALEWNTWVNLTIISIPYEFQVFTSFKLYFGTLHYKKSFYLTLQYYFMFLKLHIM